MENASKALLIAASVLITIILIAFGINIFNSSKNTSENAEQVGSTLSSQTAEAKAKLILTLSELDDFANFDNYLKTNYPEDGTYSASDIRLICHLIMQRSVRLYGKIYESTDIHVTSR